MFPYLEETSVTALQNAGHALERWIGSGPLLLNRHAKEQAAPAQAFARLLRSKPQCVLRGFLQDKHTPLAPSVTKNRQLLK